MADCEALDHWPNIMRKPVLQSKKSTETVTNALRICWTTQMSLVTVNDVELLFTEALFLWDALDVSMFLVVHIVHQILYEYCLFWKTEASRSTMATASDRALSEGKTLCLAAYHGHSPLKEWGQKEMTLLATSKGNEICISICSAENKGGFYCMSQWRHKIGNNELFKQQGKR